MAKLKPKANLGAYGSDASVCHSCGARVLWCRFTDGKDRPVEDCPIGVVGDVAILPPLFGGEKIEARKVTTRTAYRMHHKSCPQAESWRTYMIRRQTKIDKAKAGK